MHVARRPQTATDNGQLDTQTLKQIREGYPIVADGAPAGPFDQCSTRRNDVKRPAGQDKQGIYVVQACHVHMGTHPDTDTQVLSTAEVNESC
jgi:hypothetical protein